MPSGLLDRIGEERVRELLATARRRRFARNEVVFHRGDPAEALHVVQAGRFAAQAMTPLGDVVVFSLLGPGDVFGELALLGEDAHRSATVVALEPARTLSIHQLDMSRLRKEQPAVTDVLIEILVQQVRRLSEHLLEALYVPVEDRVRRRLVGLADTYSDGSVPFTIPLTQETLASLAGTSRATVNKVLREEQRRGRVELNRGKVTVLDLEAIARQHPLR